MKTIDYLIGKVKKNLESIDQNSWSYMLGNTGEYETKEIKALEEIKATNNYDDIALAWAENIGVYNYKVKANKMIYISYFGREGFYKVTHDLDTMEETRKHQASTTLPYNYYCG